MELDIFANEKNCEKCTNSRTIVSENGYKRVCTLSATKMYNCIIGREDHKKPITASNCAIRNRGE